MNFDFLHNTSNEKKQKEYVHYLNKLNDELMEVDLIENGNILYLIDLERIFTSNSQIVEVLRHKTHDTKKKKVVNLLVRQQSEIEASHLQNYKENLFINSPEVRSNNKTNNKNDTKNILEIQQILNDLLIYKEVIKFITKDIYSEDHVFYELKTVFNNYFQQKYDKTFKNSHSSIEKTQTPSDIQENARCLTKAIFDVQQFTRLFLEIIYLFYNIKSLLGETNNPIFSLKNLTYFLISHIFNNNNYRIIHEMFRNYNQSQELKLQENLKFFQGITNLRLFHIPPKYCLENPSTVFTESSPKNTAHFNLSHNDSAFTDKESDNFFSAKGSFDRNIFLSVYSFSGRNPIALFHDENSNSGESQAKDSIVDKEFIENSEDQQFFDINGEFQKEIIITGENNRKEPKSTIDRKESKEECKLIENKQIFGEKNIDKYYSGAISCLNSIVNLKSSLNKIKVLKKTIQKIYFCIHSFYKENHMNLPTDLDNMEINSIFIYVIVNSEISDLLTECNIIENFTLCNVFDSIGGYYFVIFRLILQFFLNIDIKSIKNNEKEAFFSEFCQNIIERLRKPDEYTKEVITNLKKSVHKNYKNFDLAKSFN